MILNDLSSPDLCRLGKRNFFFGPGRFHHALRAVLHVPCRTLYHITDTVDEAHTGFHSLLNLDPGSFFWNKLRLCRGYGFSPGTLWKFIYCTLLFKFIGHIRKHHFFHKPLDKCGFSGAHRTDHSNVNLALAALLDIVV